jgi:hypothetical protein
MRQAIEQMMKATYGVVTDVHALTDSVITVAEKNFPTTEFRVNDDGKIAFPISQTMVGTIARNLNAGTVIVQVVENGNIVAEAVLSFTGGCQTTYGKAQDKDGIKAAKRLIDDLSTMMVDDSWERYAPGEENPDVSEEPETLPEESVEVVGEEK